MTKFSIGQVVQVECHHRWKRGVVTAIYPHQGVDGEPAYQIVIGDYRARLIFRSERDIPFVADTGTGGTTSRHSASDR